MILFLKINFMKTSHLLLSSLLSSLFSSFPFFLSSVEVCPQPILIEVCEGNSIKLYHLIIVWLLVSYLIKLSLILLINKGNNTGLKRTIERNSIWEALITEFGSIVGNHHHGLLCLLTGSRHWGLSGKQVKIPDLMKLS